MRRRMRADTQGGSDSQADPFTVVIRRTARGTIDHEHYLRRGRRLRSRACVDSVARLRRALGRGVRHAARALGPRRRRAARHAERA